MWTKKRVEQQQKKKKPKIKGKKMILIYNYIMRRYCTLIVWFLWIQMLMIDQCTHAHNVNRSTCARSNENKRRTQTARAVPVNRCPIVSVLYWNASKPSFFFCFLLFSSLYILYTSVRFECMYSMGIACMWECI